MRILLKNNNNFLEYSIYLRSNNQYSILEDLLLLKRYSYRNFGYTVKFCVQTNSVTKLKKIALLRSPFVHKKSQEHFGISYYKKKINISFYFFIKNFLHSYWVFFLIRNFLKNITTFHKISYSLVV